MYNHSKTANVGSQLKRLYQLTQNGRHRFQSIFAVIAVSSLLFLPAYSADLNVNAPIWSLAVGQINNDQMMALKVDNMGSPVGVGFFHGTEMDFGGKTISSTQKDVFIAKYEPNTEGVAQWVRSIGGSGIDEGRGVAIDLQDAIYVTGNFRGSANLGSGTQTSKGGDDIFISKFNADGTQVWGWNAGGPYEDEGWDIAVDSASNIYATGFFSGSVNFGNSVTSTITSTNSTNDVFLVSLDTNGAFRWVNYVAGESGDRGNGIAVDSNLGRVYTTGFIQSDALFAPGVLLDPNSRDIFLSSYSTAGQHVKTILIGDGSDRDFGQAIAVDETSGTVYVTGAYDGPATFGSDILQSEGRSDAFIAAFTQDLDYLWAVGIGGPGEDVAEAITLGADGNIYVSGWFEQTADFDPSPDSVFEATSKGDSDAFALTLDPNGNFLAVATLGGEGQEQSLGLGTDGNGTIYYGGFFNGTVDVDPTEAEELLTGGGKEDIFMAAVSSNLAPRADGDSVTTAEDSSVVITLRGSDSGGESISFSIGEPAPANGSLGEIASTGATTATVTYTPNPDFSGEDSFAFVVTDASNFSTAATISILVTPENDAPVADTQRSYTADEDTILNVALENGLLKDAVDVDAGDTLSASANPTSAAGATVTVAADGSFTYDPTGVDAFQMLAVGEVMTDTLQFTVTDSAEQSDSASASMTVEGRNDAPVANDDGGFTTPGSTVLNATTSVLGNDSDIDTSDTLSVDTTPVALPTSGAIELAADGTFSYTPNAGFSGIDTFTYRVTDSNGGEDTAEVTITVGNANLAPVLSDSAAEVGENDVLNGPNLLDSATDPNGDPMTIGSTPIVAPTSGSVVINQDGTYQYTPQTDFSGSDTFSYQVCDNGIPVLCSEATVTITVAEAPMGVVTLGDDSATVVSGSSSTIDVLGNDSSTMEGALEITAIGTPDQGGSVSLSEDQTLRYIPADGFIGTETFTYTVVDATGAEATGTVTITVEAAAQMEIYLPALVN